MFAWIFCIKIGTLGVFWVSVAPYPTIPNQDLKPYLRVGSSQPG